MEIYYLTLLHTALYIVCDGSKDLCPDGSFVLGRGLSPKDEQAALDEHNRFRKKMLDGEAPGQPRAKYMKTMTYDRVLGEKCVPISDQCVMQHIKVHDERWRCVGQNIYIEWHSQFNTRQNWTAALESWFYECYDFQYPNTVLNGRDTGHYTQVVWADSDTLGCDVISFIDSKKPWTPFCRMYTCNYGPCGNFNDLPPYEVADDSNTVSSHSNESHMQPSGGSCSDSSQSNGAEAPTATPTQAPAPAKPETGVGSLIKNIINGIFGKGKFL